ncbi:MAG: periplasmic heavy metal sensor [Methylophilaceae bacterium]
MTNKLKWALIASVILNAFLVGGLAAGAYRMLGHGGPPFAQKDGGMALRFAAEDLSLEQKRLFKKTIRESRRTSLPLVKASAEARAEVLKQLSAPTFDKLAIENAMARTREADRAVRMHMEQAIVGFAEKLSPEERQKLAEGLAKKGPLRPPPMLNEPPPERHVAGPDEDNGVPPPPPPEHERE